MAALHEIARQYADEIRDGIAWVIIWKTGRSWHAESVWLNPDSDTFELDDLSTATEILEQDPNAVMVNGYYCGHFGENMTIAELEAGILWHYEGGCNLLNWYCDKGVAFVEKTPEPMKPLRKPDRQGRFLACYTKAGQPDFKGTLTGGRAVVFEAKHTDSDKIDQSRLTPEQVESLTLHHKLGAAAFIMVSVGLENFYRVPWEVWRDMKQIYGRKHMKLEDLEPYRVQYIAGILKLLEGVEIDYTEEGGTP